MMKKFYYGNDWERRLEVLRKEDSPKDHPELFKNDRWNGRFVCFGCRETGHTMDRCVKL